MPNTIRDHKKGDTWDGVEFHFESSATVAGVEVFTDIDLTNYSFSAKFKASPQGSVIFEFSTGDGTITIPTPANGKIYFMSRVMNVVAQRYIFDIQMIAPDGKITTISDGANPLVWNIVQDIS